MIGPDVPVAKSRAGVTLAAVEELRSGNCSSVVDAASQSDDRRLKSVDSLEGTPWSVGGSVEALRRMVRAVMELM
jgi:hypothetical protein